MFDLEKLDALVAEKWLRCQRHPDADLWIYNYTERCQYENYWTPETLACRGLILGEGGWVVARPFPKFFNYGHPLATIPDEPYTVTEKIDGSLGILYRLGGEYHLATRGSFVSEQAREGTAMLRDTDLAIPPKATTLFEIVYPDNRIVVDYGGRRELVLLGAIDDETGRDVPMPSYSGPTVELHDGHALDVLASHVRPNCEGYVVAFESGHRVKIKHAEYVRLHKIVTGVNARMVWEAERNGDELDALLSGVPDEIQQWVVQTRDHLRWKFFDAERQAAAVFAMRPDVDRKGLADVFKRSGANTAVLFRMLDGKPYDDLIWKAIRPEHATPADVAVVPA
jgi:RNA ligase